MFVHNVYFWLKADTMPEAKQMLLEDCKSLLGNIPTVQNIYVGTPARTPREVVDNSFCAALTVIFTDVEGHDLYQIHELHQQFFARNNPNWERVVVYDHIEEAPVRY